MVWKKVVVSTGENPVARWDWESPVDLHEGNNSPIRERGGCIKGSINSTRDKSDPLFFERLDLSATYEDGYSIWRMDVEIVMIFHVKKHPDLLPFISLVMLSVLTLGHLAPLVLNFEALFLKSSWSQRCILRESVGWLEANKVNPEHKGGCAEGVAVEESRAEGDIELTNLIRKNEKEKKEWAEKLTKLEQQCDYLMGSAQSGSKGKASFADGLFSTTASPFTDQIMSCRLPSKFKMPEIPVYMGLGDPIEHLASFRVHTMLHATPDEVACRAFPLTLAGGAREWFRTLPPRSIPNFESFAKKFASQFMAGIVRKKPTQQLMTIKQGPQESLRSYLLRFNQERSAAESQSEQFIHCAIYQGIRKDGAFMADLARSLAEGLKEFLDQAEEFVNQEETLRAFRETEEITKENSTTGGRSKQRATQLRKEIMELRPVRRVENYNWTSVNAPAKEILMEIRKVPGYKDPSPIKGRPLPHNRHKYCHYHDSYGHWTNTCFARKEMIEKYIADGKLTRFLGKRKDPMGKHPPDRGNVQAKKAPQRERSRSRGRQDGPEDFFEIQTIAGGFGGGGETYSARNSYAKEMREVSIYAVARPLKTARREKLAITFIDEDYEGVYLPHSDALVVTMVIANHKIYRVLVDNGSSADILYKSAFDLMKISREKVSAFRFPLVGFAGDAPGVNRAASYRRKPPGAEDDSNEVPHR
ncbi:uncharacterized protein LOC133876236 [Alnus glutinosa]|uniref:uncharacterized protein LOC133876236 n=1 Tax=Alnus glutinosa TaxID=3517 RepID=UPI002D770F07|nr:uncharacterized protein LOC133876236 [Alnus glutinosa]